MNSKDDRGEAIIRKALHRSLLMLAVAAVAALGIYHWLQRPDEPELVVEEQAVKGPMHAQPPSSEVPDMVTGNASG